MTIKAFTLILLAGVTSAIANLPGGGTGEGPAVTVVDNGDGTVTMGNGLAEIVIVKATSRLNSNTFTYHEGGQPRTAQMLLGKGQYYYGGFPLGNSQYTYELATDPASNGGQYADVRLLSQTETNGTMETHFSMLRGSPGFYSTAILTHRPQDAPFEVGAWGVITRVPPNFNWLTADAWRNLYIGDRTDKGAKVPNSPHEITVNLNGSQQGEFADKFIYGQDHVDLKAWGWSSVGRGNSNLGIWLMTNMEFSNGGPMKRDVSVYPYSELNNSILTGELGMGSDGFMAKGEVWTKTCGPWFTYMNHVPETIAEPRAAVQALYEDALSQAAAEKKAWPYPWFKHEKYVPASGRGTVKGRVVIQDPGNPNTSAAGLWVGLEQQPNTIKGLYDFQKWLKPYQFWVQTDEMGNFTIPNVLPGDNYTLWAYGPGAAGTFLSQEQTGGNPPLEYNLPAKPFAVKVQAGAALDLGTVTWTPVRVGPTVFELGYPNRKASKFRHGEDYWSPEKSPKLGYPTPIWGGQMFFPVDFPEGLHYAVGRSKWATDWNYVLPSSPDPTGTYQPCTGTITFDLAVAPAAAAKASLYLGCAGDDGGHIVVSLNGVDLDSAPGVTGQPNPLDANDLNTRNKGKGGFNPPYSDDSSIHFGDHGPFSDERINFPASMLRAGENTLTIRMDARSLTAYLMLDYLRLELTGYVPPAPAKVTTYAGNHRNVVQWPLVPGATSYDLLRSTAAGSDTLVVKEVVGPVCGSGPSVMIYTDLTASNGTEYRYVVQSVNPLGHSVSSAPSAAVTPSATLSSQPPSAPASLKVKGAAHRQVALSWTASPGANFYRVSRTTLREDGAGGTNPLRTILLDDTTAGTTYTDATPSDGRMYSYQVEAVNAAGTGAPSAAVTAVPQPPLPASAPGALAATWTKIKQGAGVTLNWSAVPGASGYVIYRSTHADGSFRWPEDFVTTLVETTYLDKNEEKNPPKDPEKLISPGRDYYYQVTAVNSAGVSPSATVHLAPQ